MALTEHVIALVRAAAVAKPIQLRAPGASRVHAVTGAQWRYATVAVS